MNLAEKIGIGTMMTIGIPVITLILEPYAIGVDIKAGILHNTFDPTKDPYCTCMYCHAKKNKVKSEIEELCKIKL